MKRILAIGAVICLAVGAAAARGLAAGATCEEAVTLEERVAPSSLALRDWLGARSAQLLDRGGFLELEGRLFPVSWAALGITLDLDETERALRTSLPGRECSELAKLKRRFAEAPAASTVVAPKWSFDADRARQTLRGLEAEVALEPVDARLDLRGHERIDDQPGRALDIEATLAEIARGTRDEGTAFRLITRDLSPAVTRESLANVDVSLVLAAYESDFARLARARVPNIRRAAELLNGAVIAPGGELSFNRTVGPRLEERGFKKAPVIVADVTETGVGGGVCQVASTLHAAARYGGLEVISRRSHSRPSGYVPLGLDAVVLDGEVDLKLRNPYSTPLIVHAFLPTATRLRVELLGRDPPRRVSHGFTVEEREQFERLVLVRSDYAEDRIKKHQKGVQGYRGYSVVRVEGSDGSVSVRRYESRYYPAPEVFWVGSAVKAADLPPVPEGVTRVEVQAFGTPRVTESPALAAE
jgi:vancomycin resistance protein YoaR